VIARTRLGRSIAVALSIALSQIAAPLAQAADAAAPAAHLLKPDQVTARLAERAAERQAQVALVQDVLGGSEARKQAGAMGVDIEKLRSAVPHLSDSELKDLSQRATQVKDVAAGHHTDDSLLILALVMLIAAIVILIVVAEDHGYYDCCYY